MTDYLGEKPSPEDCLRNIILHGKNVACYKFALAKSLLELAPTGKEWIALEQLAELYSRHTIEHLQICPTQSQESSNPYPFLEACKQSIIEEITKEELIEITVKKGLQVVFEKFHNVNRGVLPVSFFQKKGKGIILTDDLFKLWESYHYRSLLAEIESRWNLVEKAWELKIPKYAVTVNYDSENNLFYINQPRRRINVTPCRPALNGYQKGKCFYCFNDISIESGSDSLAEVDHFLPWVLGRDSIIDCIDGVWNLVLACKICNPAKSNFLPDSRFLIRLSKRNEFFIDSHHPLRETLIGQTGESKQQRERFLNYNYETAKRRLIYTCWKPQYEDKPAF